MHGQPAVIGKAAALQVAMRAGALDMAGVEQLDQAAQSGDAGVGLERSPAQHLPTFVGVPGGGRHAPHEVAG
ncbi:hypothetical protein D3C84_1033200 [compost metagenome]